MQSLFKLYFNFNLYFLLPTFPPVCFDRPPSAICASLKPVKRLTKLKGAAGVY